ncbi:MAG: UDP-N-acetylglucosamine 1-carboxyvinyltransferase [Clostridia bacterium]|nr:UDP-N-acetylglucosamine 1-carboxyvinyltransferase [Clostridia bacterium]
MDTYVVSGGNVLEGELVVQGSKNSALPIIASTILTGTTVILYNCPNISDTINLQNILRLLGNKITYENHKLVVDSSSCDINEIPANLMKEMRSSIILMGAILARTGRVVVSYPGGCEIGTRPIDLHLYGLQKLGANIIENHGYIICEASRLKGSEISLDFPSVGATENIMLAATLADGVTIIRNAAREPEIVELQNFLNLCGANIKGAGTSTVKIKGVPKLHEADYTVKSDRIVAGTYLCAAAMNKGKLCLKNVVIDNIWSIIHKLQETGCECRIINNDEIYIKAPKKLKAVKMIKTLPYPGFPTDMQSQMVTMLSIASGTSIVIENIFENRYKYIPELTKMGAEITIEGKAAIVKGVDKLNGATVEARELRGGASLVLAGLAADGYTKIEGTKYIERGYEDFTENLKRIGAKIDKE